MDDWTTYLSTRSLGRGYEYFESGRVGATKRHGKGWSVTVSGSAEYTVFVPESLDPLQAECTCPHFADGNICKHIAAAFISIEQQLAASDAAERPASGAETVADIVMRVDADTLRAFITTYALNDAALERELRATFGIADAKQAKRELQLVTTDLMYCYEHSGFIDWRDSMEFEREYFAAVESIIRPFLSSGDVDALIDLAIPRLVQLQRIRIDDSNGFFTGALYDVDEHISKAYSLGDQAQRRRLFEVLAAFSEKNPGRDRGDVYWFERDYVDEFLDNRFARDAQFAPDIIELADRRLGQLPPAPEDEYDYHTAERRQWAQARLKAMSVLDSSADDLHAYADSCELLKSADAVRLIAHAYTSCGDPRKAMDLLRENLNAYEPYRSIGRDDKPPRLVDSLVAIAKQHCTETELAELYSSLLSEPSLRGLYEGDLTHWFDELKRISGDDAWPAVRKDLFEAMPGKTLNTLLAHEGSYEELHSRIMADDGYELLRFEKQLVDKYPETYVKHYVDQALRNVEYAHDRRGYRDVAQDLAHAAGIPGGEEPARAAASSIRAMYPRKTALSDELASAGFAV